MKKGEIYKVNIVGLGMNGEGVAKIDGIPVFVPFAVTDDIAKIKIVHTKKDYAFGEIIEIIMPSQIRVKPECPLFTECGGCDIQHINHEAQLEFKREQLTNCLSKTVGEIPVNATVHGQINAYRNKLQLPLGECDGQVVAGFYKKSTHEIVPMSNCLLHGKWAETLVGVVLKWANGGFSSPKLSAYNEETGKGLLRHLVARYVDGFLSVTLVINGDSLPYADVLIENLKLLFDFNLYISINKQKTNVIFGNVTKCIYGEDKVLNIFGIKLPLSPLSFLQVNNEISNKIYYKTIEELNDTDIVIDVYSGVGILSALLAKNLNSNYNPSVYGIEIVPEATENANNLIKLNGLENKVKNICGDAAVKVSELIKSILNQYKKGNETPKIAIVVDPPRKGCDEKVLRAILSADAEKIIYISCNPATLARDLKVLTENYHINSATPYDMFPHTRHVETLICLSKKS